MLSCHNPKKILITGGCGFIGSNLVSFLLNAHPEIQIVNLDALTYAAVCDNHIPALSQYASRYCFVHGNITERSLLNTLFKEHEFDTVIHLAAESHVDRSIISPWEFIQTNVLGTAILLDTASTHWQKRDDVRFHHVSTDEVYGSLPPTGKFSEDSPYNPSSPYSASKASSDHFVRAWAKTYGLPVTISNCSNNYGPFQFPEKILPLMITRALESKPLPIYGDGLQVRDWLYVEDHCRAIDTILRHAPTGETYNVGGNNEWRNIDVAHLLCDMLMELHPKATGHYRDLITFVKDRPGHDRRYALDISKIRNTLHWEPQEDIKTGLLKTIQWYLDSRT